MNILKICLMVSFLTNYVPIWHKKCLLRVNLKKEFLAIRRAISLNATFVLFC